MLGNSTAELKHKPQTQNKNKNKFRWKVTKFSIKSMSSTPNTYTKKFLDMQKNRSAPKIANERQWDRQYNYVNQPLCRKITMGISIEEEK